MRVGKMKPNRWLARKSLVARMNRGWTEDEQKMNRPKKEEEKQKCGVEIRWARSRTGQNVCVCRRRQTLWWWLDQKSLFYFKQTWSKNGHIHVLSIEKLMKSTTGDYVQPARSRIATAAGVRWRHRERHAQCKLNNLSLTKSLYALSYFENVKTTNPT